MNETCPCCGGGLKPTPTNIKTCEVCWLAFSPRNLALATATRAAGEAAAVRAIVDELDKEIASIEADERFHYKPALVQVNAPLALIQVDMKARYSLAKRIRALLAKEG